MTILLLIPVYLLLFVVLPIALQIWLSSRRSRYLGLVLPVLFFLISVVFSLYPIFFGDKMLSLLLFNIPTVISLFIYIACRESIKKNARKNSEMDKTNILDL